MLCYAMHVPHLGERHPGAYDPTRRHTLAHAHAHAHAAICTHPGANDGVLDVWARPEKLCSWRKHMHQNARAYACACPYAHAHIYKLEQVGNAAPWLAFQNFPKPFGTFESWNLGLWLGFDNVPSPSITFHHLPSLSTLECGATTRLP